MVEAEAPNRGQSRQVVSNAGSFMHLLRSHIGIGVLSIPWALSRAGLVVGPVLMVVMIQITWSTMMSLVESAKYYSRKSGVPCESYGDVAYNSMQNCSLETLRKWARGGRVVVNFSIVTLQLIICSSFYVFIAQNTRQVLAVVWPGVPGDRVIMCMVFIPATLTTLYKGLSNFTWISTLGNIFYLTAFIMIVTYLSMNLKPLATVQLYGSAEGTAIFLSTVAFSVEGVTMVLPLEISMEHRQNFWWLSFACYVTLTAVAATFGAMGYVVFGSSLCESLTLNLPEADTYHDAIRILLASVLLLSYPIQFYVAMEILWPGIEDKLKPRNRICEILTKVGISSLLCIAAATLPFIGSLAALSGCLFACPLQFIYPSLIALSTKSDEKNNGYVEAECSDGEDRGLLHRNGAEDNSSTGLPTGCSLESETTWKLNILKHITTAILGVAITICALVSTITNIIQDYRTTSSSSTCRGGVKIWDGDINVSEPITMATSLLNASADL